MARTSTSDDSGTGSGRSPTDITSGPPAPRNVTAIMAWHDGRSGGRRPSPGARGDRRRRQRASSPLRASTSPTAPPGAGSRASADAVVLPGSAEEVAAVVAHCYAEGIPLRRVAAGPGSRAAPCRRAAIVVGTGRMARVRAFDPLQWRIHVEAGVSTAEVRRIARGSGLWFPPDPGAAEQSQIGGNVATNAGGPHAFKYGTTRAWVTGIEAVIPPGEVVTAGGPVRKSVAGYDLVGLLDRLGGHARDRDGGLAAAHPRRRGGAPDRRALRRRGGRLRGRSRR